VEAHGEAWTEAGITNGPFRLETRQRGEPIILTRNPDYHGRFKGNVQRVEQCLFTEGSAGLAMYEGDGLDVLDLRHFSPAEMNRARQRHAGEYVSGPWLRTVHAGFDVSRPPFDDPRVRRALTMAADRETLADVVLKGYDFPATGGLVPPGMPGHSAGIGLPYDPEQARRLLAEAGYPNGHGFPAVDSLVPDNFVHYSEYLQAQWRENLGVEITWESMELGILIDRLDREPSHVFIVGWLADYPDPDNFLRVGASDAQHWTGWWNEAYTRLVEKAKKVMDQEERMKLYGQADRILVEDAAFMPIIYERLHLLVKPWVSNFPMLATKHWFWKDVVIEPH
jgi:oligopeptide transport system substrate-binding protein